MLSSKREHELDYIMPTYAHMASKKLLEEGIAKFIVTSNHDNLHIKSGIRTSPYGDPIE